MDTPTFVDGIGRRLRTVDSTGEEVETLRLCRELSEAPSTEAALIERAGRLAAFNHPSFSQVRRVERLRGVLGGLTVVSSVVPGVRLFDLLTLAQRKWLAPDPGASLYLLEQIASALAAFHRHSREFAHGALGPERVVIRPDGHPVVVEHVLAPAIGQLQMGRALLWTQFRVPVPAVAGTARLDQMTDIMQLGILALAIVLGRPIRREEYPQKLQELLAEATTPGALGARPIASRALHGWILRTLQFESRSAFRTAADASAALDAIVAEQPRHKVSAAAVVAYVADCQAPGDGVGAAQSAVSVPPIGADTPAIVPVRDDRPQAIAEPDRSVTMRIRRADDGAAEALRPERALTESSHPSVTLESSHPSVTPDSLRPSVTLDSSRTSIALDSLRPNVTLDSSRLSIALDSLRPSVTLENKGQAALLIRPVAEASSEISGQAPLAGRAPRAVLESFRHAPRLDWVSLRRVARVVFVALGLACLFGVTYLGARGYLGLPDFMGGRGTLVVESHPSGADLYVDGFPRGQTPTTLELRAGEHTLALRTVRGTTLVPVVVVSGARRVERVEIRQRRLTPPRPAAQPRVPAPAPEAELPSTRHPQ